MFYDNGTALVTVRQVRGLDSSAEAQASPLAIDQN